MAREDYSYPWYAKLLHLGMAGFGIAAYLTGELAEDGYDSLGYLFHAYLGLSLATFVLLRVLRGFVRHRLRSRRVQHSSSARSVMQSD